MFKVLSRLILVVVVVFIAYGQTLRMYFWQDDSALIFKLQNLQAPAGSFGEGIIGSGPYKYLVVPFVPFFSIFGLNPSGYFAIGILGYFLVVFCFWLLAKELLQSKKAAYFSALIFAAGYIGSDIMFRIINSWQSNAGFTFALLSLWGLTKFLRERKIRFYITSVAFFWACVEFVFIRSHSLIFAIVALDILFSLIPFKPRKLLEVALRQIPFLLIFYNWYLRTESAGSSALSFIADKLLSGNVEITSALLATTGNALLQDKFQVLFLSLFPTRTGGILLIVALLASWLVFSFFSIPKKTRLLAWVFLIGGFFLNKFFYTQDLYWYRSQRDLLSGAIGIYGLIILLILSLALFRKKQSISKGLLFGLAVLVSQIFGYFIQYPDAIFGTTHRYLNYSLIGYSLVFGAVSFLFWEITKKRSVLALAPVIVLVSTNAILSFNYQSLIVKQRSIPTRNFYKELRGFVPSVEKGAAFYFDVKNDSLSQQQFRDFFSVGSMPESTALAIYYGVDRYDLSMLTDPDELLFLLSRGQVNIDNLHTFFYSSSGLVDTTLETRDLLKNGSNFQKWSTNSTGLVPFSPMLLVIEARVDPDLEALNARRKDDLSYSERKEIISYLLARENYYKEVSAQTLSSWRYQEENYAVDNNPQTSWRGHRIWWHDNQHDQIVLDLGRIKRIDRVVWTNWSHTLSPTTYTIDASLDGKIWQTLVEVLSGPERKDGEEIVENFDKTQARFVRMDITATVSNDAPSLTEIEVVDADFQGVEIARAREFIKNPLVGEDLIPMIGPLVGLRVDWTTDKGSFGSKIPLGEFGKFKTFEFILSPGGTRLEKVTFSVPQVPAKIEIRSALIKNLSFEETAKRGLVKSFSEN